MQGTPDRKLIRADHSMDQRTFGPQREEVGIDDTTHDEVWSDALGTGTTFHRNIADQRLGTSLQPRRGEILITRSERTQTTRALSFRARRHEQPKVTLPQRTLGAFVPRENEQRSLATAQHDRHTRAFWDIKNGTVDEGTKIRQLAFGGNLPKENQRRSRRAAALERLNSMRKRAADRRAHEPPTDYIEF